MTLSVTHWTASADATVATAKTAAPPMATANVPGCIAELGAQHPQASAQRAPGRGRRRRLVGHGQPFYQAGWPGRSTYFCRISGYLDAVHHADFALLVLRVSLGLMLMAHGANKVKGGLDNAGRWFSSMGMRHGGLQARLAAATEIGCGRAARPRAC